MTREQAKNNLIGFGIAEPTDEMISNYLNQVNGESKKYKEKAETADSLQKQLDDINAQNMTEVEKATKALETANNRIAELEKAQAISNLKADVISKFRVTAEQAAKIVKDDGSMDMDVLGQIISEKETAAATAKEQEIAKGATNPGGGNPNGAESKPADVINAEKLNFGNKASDTDVKDFYVIK